MSMLFKVCGIAVISAVSVLALRGFGQKTSVAIGSLSLLIISVALIPRLKEIADPLKELATTSGTAPYGILMLKALGVALIVHVTSDICRDLGSESLSHGIELAGRIEILLLCLPFIFEMTEAVKELLT